VELNLKIIVFTSSLLIAMTSSADSLAPLSEADARALYEKRHSLNSIQQEKSAPEAQKPWYAHYINEIMVITKALTAGSHDTTKELASIESKNPRIDQQTYRRDLLGGKIDQDYAGVVKAKEVSTFFSNQYRTAATARYVEQSELVKKYSGGLNFNFGGNSPSQPTPLKSRKNVRYGLVLKGFETDHNRSRVASLGSGDMSEWSQASKAKPVWGIGQLKEEEKTHKAEVPLYVVRPGNAHQQAQLHQVNRTPKHTATSAKQVNFMEMITGIRFPKMEFRGKAKPRSKFAVSEASSGLPGIELQINQIEDYYSGTYLTGKNFKKDRLEHKINVPLIKKIKLSQRYDEQFRVLHTSITNIVVIDGGPALSMAHDNLSNNMKANLSYQIDNHSIALTADSPAGWDIIRKFGESSDEKYELTYKWRF
jgi:hypothetical protein